MLNAHRQQDLSHSLLMTILAQSLFSFMRRHFMTFTFLTAWHGRPPFSLVYVDSVFAMLFYRLPSMDQVPNTFSAIHWIFPDCLD